MTKDQMPFDHRPDPVLGAALREALTPGDQAEFVARVLARMAHAPLAHWDVLASWARAGITAAVAALVAGLLVGHAARAPEAPVDVLAAAAAPFARALLAAPLPPDPSVVLPPTEEP